MRTTPPRLPSVLGALLVTAAIGLTVVPARAQDEKWRDSFPDISSDAARLYDLEVPPEDWIDGPVQYLILDHERDIWKKLQTDEQRRAFIAWFWGRRDIDSRDESHPMRAEFYARVAYANERFSGFPRGWRGDRGRVWISLGQPTGGMRRVSLVGYGRCSAESGEQWTYYTQNMAFNSSMGEFSVLFMETRIGQYEICDPYMLGPGGWPDNLRRALEYTNEAMVLDTVTEFGERRANAAAPAVDEVRVTAATTEPLTVPTDRWGLSGAGGAMIVPIQLPLRELLFEPGEGTLKATLIVEASLVAMGTETGRQGQQEWSIELDDAAAARIGGASVRTALALAADPGGYSVRVRVLDPLSARAWVWDGVIEIDAVGTAVTPPLAGSSVLRLRDGGEVAVLSADLPTVEANGPLFVVSWVRGISPDPDNVTVALAGADGEVHRLDGRAYWGAGTGGPLVFESTTPDLPAGSYTLTLLVAPDVEPVVTRIKIE